MKKEAKTEIYGTILIVAEARIARVYYTPLPESMRPIIGTNNQINKLLIRPGRGWGFVPVFHVSRCRAAPCCCAPSGSVPLWPHSTLGSQGRRGGGWGETRPWPRGGGPPSVQGVVPSYSPMRGGITPPLTRGCGPVICMGLHMWGLLRGSVGLTRRSGINCDYAAALIQLFTSLWITLILTSNSCPKYQITKLIQSNKFNINENFALLGARL